MAEKKQANPATEGLTAMVSPFGATTWVPDDLIEPLIESGYTKK